jgi:hypothetical protein
MDSSQGVVETSVPLFSWQQAIVPGIGLLVVILAVAAAAFLVWGKRRSD